VSTEKEINIAMKYGTNYPHGPFEWAEIIGIDRIYDLLQQLAASDSKYCPAPIIKTHST
jgi:3-hydroxybutyryl-CoA dehydrogenase